MRTRFDQLAKGILGKVLADVGEVRLQEEIAGEVQAADVLFLPAAERAAERARMGILGRMAETPCLLEPFHATPGVDAILDCLCKQLTLRRNLLRDARKNEGRPPEIPRLWILSSGRPESVLAGLGFTACEDWLAGVWQAAPSLSLFLVVLRELPATRDTLPLRLLGADATFYRALTELGALPPEDWEPQALMHLLLAFRREVPQDLEEDEMSYANEIQAIYDEWDRRVRQQARQQGLKQGLEQGEERGLRRALLSSYQARFDTMPEPLRAALEATEDEDTLLGWVPLFTTGSVEEIAAAVLGPGAAQSEPVR